MRWSLVITTAGDTGLSDGQFCAWSDCDHEDRQDLGDFTEK